MMRSNAIAAAEWEAKDEAMRLLQICLDIKRSRLG